MNEHCTVTPLDVVRVRLQSQQHTPSPVRPHNISSSTRPSPFVNIPPNLGVTACCREVFWVTNTANYCVAAPRLSAASTEAAASVTDCAVQETRRRTFDSTLDGLRKIARNEGLTTLWRGLSPTLVMAVPANVIYFTGYDWLRTSPHSLISQRVSDTYAPLVAGSSARVLAAICVSPIEMFRTRMQAAHTPSAISASSTKISASKAGSHYGETLAGIRELVKLQGYTALWRGLGLTLWRDVPFSAIYWWGYERGRHALSDLRNRSSGRSIYSSPSNPSTSTTTSTADDHSTTLIDSFIAGAGSGAIAALLTTPFDVGKTRQQVVRDSSLSSSLSSHSSSHLPNNNNKNNISSSSKSSSSSSAHRHRYTRPEELPMPRFLWHIFQEQGLRGLFRGWVARCLKVAPACAIMISSYELGKKMAVDMNVNT